MDTKLYCAIMKYQEFIKFKINKNYIMVQDDDPYDETLSLAICNRFYSHENELLKAIDYANTIISMLQDNTIDIDDSVRISYLGIFFEILANLYYVQGEYNKAAEYFNYSLTIINDDKTSWVGLLFSIRALGEFELFNEGIFGVSKGCELLNKQNTTFSTPLIKSSLYKKNTSIKQNIQQHKMGVIQIARYCNQNCIFCSVPPSSEQLAIEEVKNKINSMKQNNVDEIMFTGGEPTLSKDLMQIIIYAASVGFKIIALQTNGVMLSNEMFVKTLRNSGLNRVYFSFHSYNEEIYNLITNTTGMFRNAISGMQNCEKFGIEIIPTIVICTYNYKILLDHFIYITEKFRTIRTVNIMFVDPIGLALNNISSIPKMYQVEVYLIKALKYLESKSINFWIEFLPLCYLRGFENHSTESNRITTQSDVMYKFCDKKMQYSHSGEIYVKYNQMGIQDEACKCCHYNDICVKLNDRYYKLFGSKELYPIF